MALDQFSISVLTRPLPKDKIQSRPGKAGMVFHYISPDFVIDTLNEAFGYAWSTKIVYSQLHENVAVVGLQLSVPDGSGGVVIKEQFGSCEITRGLGVGEAFKGATSDAMKKSATLLGLGLELYKDEDTSSSPSFTPPPRNNVPKPPTAPPAPPRPVVSAPAAPRPPAPPAPRPPAPPAPRESSPFAEPKSAVVARPQVPTPPRPVAKPAAVNPFQNRNAAQAGGPSTTQLNSLTNIATRKGVSQEELISLAGITDEHGSPVVSFEQLSYSQAISVIQAAQH